VDDDATAVIAGSEHSCAIRAGRLECWGQNGAGQLGDGSTTHRTAPVDVLGLPGTVASAAAGLEHTCAVSAGGGVLCWGDNTYGQLGDGTNTERRTPAAVVGLASGVIAVTAGDHHSCALTSSGGVRCWGRDRWGQLGDGAPAIDHAVPVDVLGLASGVRSLAAGGDQTCAITDSGGVLCWGADPMCCCVAEQTPVAVLGFAREGTEQVGSGTIDPTRPQSKSLTLEPSEELR
jgi:hypothetical protein